MISAPSLVTTICSSIRAADQPSDAGQNVSSAKTMFSWITSGWSIETSLEKTGFSQMESPTPWPSCSANAASSLAKPNSSAFGNTLVTSAVVTPGFTSAIAGDRVHTLDEFRALFVQAIGDDGHAFVLANARLHRSVQLVVRGVDHRARLVQESDLVFGLDHAGALHDLLAVEHLDAR